MAVAPGPVERSRRLTVAALVRRFGREGGGGAERAARDLLVELDPERFERILFVSRAATDPEGRAIAADLRRRGVRLVFLRRRFKYDPLAWWPMLRALRAERVDVLHGHSFGQNVWAGLVGRLAGVPVVVAHEHNWAFEGRPLRPVLDRHLVARCSDAIVVVSREARRRMLEQEGIAADRLVVLPNGIRRLPAGDGGRVRAELGIGPRDPVIGAVCVIRREKALDLLVRAAEPLLHERPRLRVLIAGRGPERPAVEALVRRLGLEGRVVLLGMRSDVPDVLAALDVAVLCSDFEGIPLALLEYMDAGKAIVATKVGGVPELIEDEQHGLLVPPRDAAALSGAIRRLLDDPERAAAMGARARERCRREFSMPSAIGRLEDLYDRLYAARPRSDRRGRA